jgi:hypothetical protein
MKLYGVLLACVALFAALAAVTSALVIETGREAKPTPARVIRHEGLKPFPVLDSRQQIGADIFIVCRAYSNRPGFDIHAAVTDSALGFRVLSDCRTVRG